MSLIGDEIKRTRRAYGMTSRGVAAQVTLTPQYVRLMECGGAIPALDTVLRICNLFPDADSGHWAWLLIHDLYGDGIGNLLWRYARAADGPVAMRPAAGAAGGVE